MAPPTLGLCRQALRLSHRTQWLSYRQWQAAAQTHRSQITRNFSNTPSRRDDDNSKGKANTNDPNNPQKVEGEPEQEGSEEDGIQVDNSPHFNDSFYSSLYSNAKDSYLKAEPWERRMLENMHSAMYQELGSDSEVGRNMDAFVEREVDRSKEELDPEFFERPDRPVRPQEDFSTMADPEMMEIAPDEEIKEDDISSLAHAELDVHREMREYSRLAAWEMPLLANLALPFKKPTKETPLRWRYTTYLGTPHPAAHKVVMTFQPGRLDLTTAQRAKLIKLAGPRYDPHKRTVKMSSESFPSQAQNKRYLGSQLAKLLAEARDPADTMEDIPFDFRHARKPPVHRFPQDWVLTPSRKAALERTWKESADRDNKAKELPGGPVEGARLIEEARAAPAAASVLEEITVAAAAGKQATKGSSAARSQR